jgi:hypothetical protein
MSDDALISAAQLRGKQLLASRKQAEADLARHVANGDEAEAADTLGELAAIDGQGAALNHLYNQHVQANTLRQPEPDSGNEWLAKPSHKMGGDDALKIVNYGKHPSDPTWLSAEDYNKQQRELIRLKAQGMYKD